MHTLSSFYTILGSTYVFTYCMLSIGCREPTYFSIILTHMCVHIGSLCMDDIWYKKAIKTHSEHVDSPGAVWLVFQSCRTNEMRHSMRAPSTTTLPFVLFLRRTFFYHISCLKKVCLSLCGRIAYDDDDDICVLCAQTVISFLTRFIEHIEFHTFRTMDAT